jgi:hypothetical protein
MAFNLDDCDLIVIEAEDTDSGIDAEYAYISEQYGPFGVGWVLQRQKVLSHVFEGKGDLKQIDVLTIELENGEVKDIVFDITSFYGKWG